MYIAYNYKLYLFFNLYFQDVSLDSVELTFKDQYLARSDMWRLKTRLVSFSFLTKIILLLYNLNLNSSIADLDT